MNTPTLCIETGSITRLSKPLRRTQISIIMQSCNMVQFKTWPIVGASANKQEFIKNSRKQI